MFAHRVGLLVFLGALAWPQGENGGKPPTTPSFTSPVEVVLTGRVTDKHSGAPIQGAQLSIEGETRGTLTDRNGEYALSFSDGWAGRRITIVVQHVGYNATRKRIRLAEGSNTLDLTLAPPRRLLEA